MYILCLCAHMYQSSFSGNDNWDYLDLTMVLKKGTKGIEDHGNAS